MPSGAQQGLENALAHYEARTKSGNVVLNQAALDKLLESDEGPVGKMLLRKSIQVEGAAKRGCPVDTGRLRASITHTLERDSQGLVAYIGTNVAYARFVEFGTRFAPAQPFLRPALRSKT